MISLFLTVCIATLLASYTSLYITKARISGAFMQFPSAKADLMAAYAYLGRWPNEVTININSYENSDSIDEVRFDGEGALNVYFSAVHPSLSNKVLSFVANITAEGQSDKIVWSCGYAAPLDGFKPMSLNLTSIEAKYLPNSCK